MSAAIPHAMESLFALWRDFCEFRSQPQITVNLMRECARENDPFFAGLVDEYYRYARMRHLRCPIFGRMTHGVAIATLPDSFDAYFMQIEAAGRRNFKKAQRSGYSFSRIDYNRYLDDIGRIRRSADYRQGKMPESFLNGPIRPVDNPLSRTNIHDYPYVGVLRDGCLYAYAGCFVAGEVCMIEHIYGDAAVQSDGIVPMLIISIAEYILTNYPHVKYYGYGTYFGARDEMRRFKRKFDFTPHCVAWLLGAESSAWAPPVPNGAVAAPGCARE